MKHEQRRKSAPYSETVKARFPKASYEQIQRLINIQNGKAKP